MAPWPNTRTHPPVDGEVAEALRRMTRGRTSRHGQVSSLRWSSWARHVSPRAPRRLGWLGWLPPHHIFGHVDVALGFISLRQLKAAPAVVVESHSSFFPKCYTTSTKDAFLGSFAEAFIGHTCNRPFTKAACQAAARGGCGCQGGAAAQCDEGSRDAAAAVAATPSDPPCRTCQVPGRVRIRQILLRAWRGGTAPKPEEPTDWESLTGE